MIAFSCAQCGMKFQVKPEFAGRSARCPTCKHLLAVPAPERNGPRIAPGGTGTASSLAQAGVEGGVTLDQATLPPRSDQRPVDDLLARRNGGERYLIDKEIARGGMGAVMRAVDGDIRREVAVKYLLNQTDQTMKIRFVEEAQITGQLEHPNIVPIHELGVDAQKRLFFSMKMVRGRSLAQILDELRESPRTGEKEYPLSRLLTIFVSVCHGLAYAHSRGVIHRDLKPANIMVGDFGEVYVMDWGLAKVIRSDGAATAATSAAPAAPAERSPSATQASRVATSREEDADLTQDGAVMGTPVYMAPEQANGQVHAIDERSDVYALGAILYELLTLQSPIARDGDCMAILVRVVEGQILPPARRAPERARAGKIPRELSAVAMKALARAPADRYPGVAALQRDIERFQEGRSVSARQDTAREVLWKLVKRNRAASVATAAALLVIAVILAFSIKLINDGRLHAEEQRRRAEKAYEAQRVQEKESVPVLLEAARFAVERRRFPEALAQVGVAVEYHPDHAGARLFRARLLIAERNFPAARADLEKFLELQPGDAAATRLLELCRIARAEDTRSITALADAFLSQDEVALAAHLVQTRKEQLAVYRKRIETAWPKAKPEEFLTMDRDGNCSFEFATHPEATDLEPLRGVPLTRLKVTGPGRKLRDLGALRDMPLKVLDLRECVELTDLTPLRGLKLKRLGLYGHGAVQDLSPLEGMKLKSLTLSAGTDDSLIPQKELNVLRSMPLISLELGREEGLHDLSILSETPLKNLQLYNCWRVADLAPLKDLKLKRLALLLMGVRDLRPLANLPLETLDLDTCLQVTDLTGLGQIQTLRWLSISTCDKVKQLTPLAGLKLETIILGDQRRFSPKELEVLRGMKSLKWIYTTYQHRFTPQQFWKKYDAGGFGK